MDRIFAPGDLVQQLDGGPVMKVLACGLKSPSSDTMDGVLCSWTDKKYGYEWVYDKSKLQLVRKERRLIPRWSGFSATADI
ncbi:MAG: hypothetical protein V4754_14085 [Pseudomonadota bacterium]